MSTNTRLHIIKIGGNVIDDEQALDLFLEKFSALKGKKILVHGGGKSASRLAKDLGVKVQMVEGRRVTDGEMLKIVTMVYAGLTNKNIVANLQKHDCEAIGLSGADANTIEAVKRPKKEIDYGFVGDILHDSVNTSNIKKLLESGFIPVFSAITHNGKGQLLNTNADTIASAIAVAMTESFDVSLVYCFEKSGVLKDLNDDSSFFDRISLNQFQDLKEARIIHDGMIPKLQNAFDAISKGVNNVYIGHALNLHMLQQSKFGTHLTR